MRALGVATTTVLALVLGGAAGTARADDHPVPSRQQVEDARAAVAAQADDVAAVRARLAVANQRLEQSAVAADQASEAYNGARWKAQQARRAAARANARAAAAATNVAQQRQAYADAVATSYELSPGLTALAAVVNADGIDAVLRRTATVQDATEALNANYDEYRAASVVARVAHDQAESTRRDAEHSAQQALAAKQAAQRAADAAIASAQSIAAEKTALIARLAQLQHISVQLAQQRQSALEARAAAAAAAAAEQAAEEQAAQEQAAKAAQQKQHQAQQQPQQQPQQTQEQGQEQGQQSDPPPPADPPPADPPAPSSGAGAAISFARAQLGEPYRWGAAGPNAWDCSGLTMGAWRAGGISLPHYSGAQYDESTPISASQLRPGDLVFWGSSSDPGSIFHVALYVGGGRIVQAPRTGRPVSEDSMYYWTPPNFFARP